MSNTSSGTFALTQTITFSKHDPEIFSDARDHKCDSLSSFGRVNPSGS